MSRKLDVAAFLKSFAESPVFKKIVRSRSAVDAKSWEQNPGRVSPLLGVSLDALNGNGFDGVGYDVEVDALAIHSADLVADVKRAASLSGWI